MRHLGKLKKVAITSVLVASMVVSMVNFGINSRNGPKKDDKVLDREEDGEVVDNKVGSYATSESVPPKPEYTVVCIGDYLS